MDVTQIAQIVSTLGFPIAMCLLFFWYITKRDEQHKEEIKAIQDQHREESAKMTEAINNNTLVVQRLLDKIGD